MSTKGFLFDDEYIFSENENRMYASEKLIYNISEDIIVSMEDKDISQSQLAKKLGKSKSFVSKLLNGSRNMTLKTLSDICFALDITPEIKILKEKIQVCHTARVEFYSYSDSVVHEEPSSDFNRLKVLESFNMNSRIIFSNENLDYKEYDRAA